MNYLLLFSRSYLPNEMKDMQQFTKHEDAFCGKINTSSWIFMKNPTHQSKLTPNTVQGMGKLETDL